MGPDGTRSDCAVLLSPRSSLLVVCFGKQAEKGSPLEAAHRSVRAMAEHRVAQLVEAPQPESIAGCEAVRYVVEKPDGIRITEHRFVREGWLFGVGVVKSPRDRRPVESRARAVLDTWRWLPGTEETVNPPYQERELVRASARADVRAGRDRVWWLVRSPDATSLLLEGFVEGFRVPGSPDGVGEQHRVTVRSGSVLVGSVIEVEDEQPGVRVTFLRRPWQGRTSWFLEEVPGGTRVSVEADQTLVTGERRGSAEDQRRELQRELDRLLARLVVVAER